jgi:hypothetical protein
VENGQPEIVHRFVCCTVCWPDILTLGFGTVSWACPPCMQRTVAPWWSRYPAITLSPMLPR